MPSNQWLNLVREEERTGFVRSFLLNFGGRNGRKRHTYLWLPISNLPGPFLRKFPLIQSGIVPVMKQLMGSGVSSTELTIFSMLGRPCTSVKCLMFLLALDFLSAVKRISWKAKRFSRRMRVNLKSSPCMRTWAVALSVFDVAHGRVRISSGVASFLRLCWSSEIDLRFYTLGFTLRAPETDTCTTLISRLYKSVQQ